MAAAHKWGSSTEAGAAFPNVAVDIGFAGLDPKNRKMSGDLNKGQKTLWIPGLKKAEIEGKLEEAGIDKVYIFAVNDGAVMNAWKKDQGLGGSDLIEFVADTHAELTVALDLVLTTHAGPAGVLGAHTMRCKRSSMYVVDGTVKLIRIAEAEDDPAGDAKPEASLIEAMLPLIAAL